MLLRIFCSLLLLDEKHAATSHNELRFCASHAMMTYDLPKMLVNYPR